MFRAVLVLAAFFLVVPAQVQAGVSTMAFGKTLDGKVVTLYLLSHGKMTVKVMDYGAIVTEIDVPDRDGQVGDVVLGFENLDGYLGAHPYFGATVGRVANRIANGAFTLNGKTYTLARNNGPNTLHGGLKGFDKVVWKGQEVNSPEGPAVRFTYTSPSGEEGFPGTLLTTVTYTLVADQNALKIDYTATTDEATPINLTNHSYFNLAGPASGDVLGHEIMIAADRYTPGDDKLIPTGELAPVKGTPLDFTEMTAIGARINQIKADPVGYDHNYVIRDQGKAEPRLAARVHEPKTGRVMEVLTTEPGVQFYTGNFLDGSVKGKDGVAYKKHQGFCLETQHFPDSVNQPRFPSTILEPGQTYKQTTIYRFSTE